MAKCGQQFEQSEIHLAPKDFRLPGCQRSLSNLFGNLSRIQRLASKVRNRREIYIHHFPTTYGAQAHLPIQKMLEAVNSEQR